MYPEYPYYGYEIKCTKNPITFPPQHQKCQPGIESKMVPRPIFNNPDYEACGRLVNKVAIITGGDSGIGLLLRLLLRKKAQMLP